MLFYILLLFSSITYAADYHSPRTSALGGAGRGGPLLTDAIYLSPAMASFLPAYAVSTSFNGHTGKEDTEPKGRTYHFSLQDGRNEFFQAGLGYTRRADGAFLHLGVSKAVAQKYGVGIGSKYAFKSHGRAKAYDSTLSVIGSPIEWFQGSMVIDNLVETNKGKDWNLYREFVLGTKFSVMNLLMIYFDPHLIPNKPGKSFGYELGVELPLFTDFYLRIGKSENSMQPHIGTYGDGYGWGFGWIFPRLSIDAAIYRSVGPVLTDNKIISMTISY